MLGHGLSFHADLVSHYTDDFYSLCPVGLPSGHSSLDVLAEDYLYSTLLSAHRRCDWCGQRLCIRCGECHNPDCEVYYELGCADLNGEEDEDERYADLLDCLELIDEVVDVRCKALSHPQSKEQAA